MFQGWYILKYWISWIPFLCHIDIYWLYLQRNRILPSAGIHSSFFLLFLTYFASSLLLPLHSCSYFYTPSYNSNLTPSMSTPVPAPAGGSGPSMHWRWTMLIWKNFRIKHDKKYSNCCCCYSSKKYCRFDIFFNDSR